MCELGVVDIVCVADRYVLLGNHRDAWTLGGVDPTSATALMVELSRVFMQLVKDGRNSANLTLLETLK